MSIYRIFSTDDDIIRDDIETVTQPIWSENLNPLSASSAGLGFFTSSVQSGSSGQYYVSVYQRNPSTEPETAEIQFAVAYGHRLGSGSVGDPTVVGVAAGPPLPCAPPPMGTALCPADPAPLTI